MKSLAKLSSNEEAYRPSILIRKQLESVSLVCVVGGVASGKNLLMKASGLPVVGRVTSRPPRPDDDPKVYKYFSNEAMTEMIEKGKLVQYAVDLGNNVIYGSLPSDYVTGKPVLMDTWSWSVEMLKNKGFGHVRAVSVVTPWDQWKRQLETRFAARDEHYRQARLEEVATSLAWTKAQLGNPDHLVIVNNMADTETSAQRLKDFARGKPVATDATVATLIDSLEQAITHERSMSA